MLGKSIHQYWVVQFFISLLLVVLTRLPYLLGEHVYFDGDEAIIGIMAQDLLHGKNLPVYFYGQQYGFSFFEVAGVAIGILLFGNSVLALKVGGMLVFSVGISFLLRLCLRQNLHFWASCAIVLVICCFPSWLLWATKPRGGYITAFTCSCILLYIFQSIQPSVKSLILVSVVLAISIHSQVLITIPIGFYFLYWIISSKNKRVYLYSFVFLILGITIIKLPAFMNEAYWRVPMSFQWRISNLTAAITEFPRLIAGAYFYELTFPVGRFVARNVFTYFLIGCIITAILFFRMDKKTRWLMVCLLAGGLVSFLAISFMTGGIYRYTLGLFTACMFILFLALMQLIREKKAIKTGTLLILSLIGFGCGLTIRTIPAFWLHPEKNDGLLYTGLINHLEKRNIQHVFVLDPMLQWQLNYSGFPSRCTSKNERINRYLQAVDDCYKDPGCTTALVGYTGFFNYTDSLNDWNTKVVIVNERFFVYEKPEDRHLKAGGFEN